MPAARRSLLALGAALSPLTTTGHHTAQGCGYLDFDCYADAFEYQFNYGIAANLWAVNRALLALVYQLDQLRVWVVRQAFQGAYDALAGIVSPLIAPAATIAVLVGCLLFLALPLLGRVQVINVRQALVWALVAPLLLAHIGNGLAVVEQTRAAIGGQIFGAAQQAPGKMPLFGPQIGDMADPRPLYSAGEMRCGISLARPSLDESQPPAGLRMDDLAAALLWADATDIHCPGVNAPRPEVPHRFFQTQPGYAFDGDINSSANAAERQGYVDGIKHGVTRLVLGLFPSALAVVEALIQLLFTLCLAALWAAFALALLLVFFQQDLSILLGLVRRAGGVIVTSWVISFVLGILFACLLAAARLANATAFVGLAIGGLLLCAWLLGVAVDALKAGIAALGAVALAGTGLAFDAPLRMAQRTVGGGLAIVTEAGIAAAASGVGTAAALAGRKNTAEQRVPDANNGRLRPTATVGSVAAEMGAPPASAPAAEPLRLRRATDVPEQVYAALQQSRERATINHKRENDEPTRHTARTGQL
jgi:hypothetical protein